MSFKYPKCHVRQKHFRILSRYVNLLQNQNTQKKKNKENWTHTSHTQQIVHCSNSTQDCIKSYVSCSEVQRGEQFPGNVGVGEFSHRDVKRRFIPDGGAVLFVHHQTAVALSAHRLVLVSTADHFHL